MAGRIVLFGATGYTGELVARELAGIGERPVLAGRDAARLRTLAASLGDLDTVVASVGDASALRSALSPGDVLVSCVGPFARWGGAAVEAALAGGASYLDSTGETAFIRRVFEEFGPRAVEAGCGLVTAMGYDWVPGNLAGALALREAGEGATRVAVGYFMTGDGGGAGAMSGGTRASAAGVFLEPSFAWRGGRLVTERPGARVRSFVVDGRARKAISAGSSEHYGLPAVFPGLRDVEVGLGWFGGASDALRVFSSGVSLLMRVPSVRGVLSEVVARGVKGSTGGPDAEARAASGSLIVAEAADDAGRVLARVRLEGVNGYDFTAGMLAWGAHAAANGRLHGVGALGPVEGFGLDALCEGARSAGISRDA